MKANNTRSMFDEQTEPYVVSNDGRRILRGMIQHEDDLRNQRLGYFLTLNGLLFAGLAFGWKAPHALSLVVVLAALGIAISITAFCSMLLSDRAIRYLRRRDPVSKYKINENNWTTWNTSLEDELTTEEEIQSIPVALSDARLEQGRVMRFFQPWKALPTFLFLAWVAILVLGSIYLPSGS